MQINQSVALSVVVNRPKDLTREQLREIRLFLDQHEFGEAKLRTAWSKRSNREIAASVIGYIRQAALGEALIPFEQRVANAMQKIYDLQSWNEVQRKWLGYLANQLVHEVVVDRQQLNRAFATDGGLKRLDKLLGGQLEQVLETLGDNLWTAAA
ncbi:type I restriction enzyme EcoKI subunit R [compost metagenome]